MTMKMSNKTKKESEYEKSEQLHKKWNSLLYSFIFHIFVVFVGILSIVNINLLEDALGEYTLFYLIWWVLLYFVSIWLLFINGFRS